MRRPARLSLCAAAVASMMALAARPASGSSFTVDPTLIELSARASSALLAVRNESAQPVRLQLSAFAWAQSLTGEMQLAPTEDVVFYPTLLTLQPGESRRVRVGTTASFGAVEKSYRLFVEELPPERKSESEGVGIRVLTKMGVPVFLRPVAPRVQTAVRGMAFSGGSLSFRLDNTGTVHVVPESVRVTGQTETGETLIDRKLQGWYVLAGDARVFSVAVTAPPSDCGRVRWLAAEVQVGGTVLRERLETPRGTCGP